MENTTNSSKQWIEQQEDELAESNSLETAAKEGAALEHLQLQPIIEVTQPEPEPEPNTSESPEVIIENVIGRLRQGFGDSEDINDPGLTQLTGARHEKFTFRIFQQEFNCDIILNAALRRFITSNGHTWRNIRTEVPDSILINDLLDFNLNTNYITMQPSGGQDYPDIVMFNFKQVENGLIMQLAFIECKQESPTFNNNPPKKKKNCLYVCGKELYSGYLLTSDDFQQRFQEFRARHVALCEEFNSDDMKCVPYRKVELRGWIKGEGTSFFRENQAANVPCLIECLARYI